MFYDCIEGETDLVCLCSMTLGFPWEWLWTADSAAVSMMLGPPPAQERGVVGAHVIPVSFA